MQSPPPHVIAGQPLSAAHYNALLDYVLRTTPRQGRGMAFDYRSYGTFIHAAPVAGGGAALPLFPFAVKIVTKEAEEGSGAEPEKELHIYLPKTIVARGTDSYFPKNVTLETGEWYKIDGVELPTSVDETLFAVIGREIDEEISDTQSVVVMRLMLENAGGELQDTTAPESFYALEKVPIARITAKSTAEGTTENSVVQLLYTAFPWPAEVERPWTFDAAQKSWRNAAYQVNRYVGMISSTDDGNIGLGDGYYYLEIDNALKSAQIVTAENANEPSTDEKSLYYVGRVVDGKAVEGECPHHIPVCILYE